MRYAATGIAFVMRYVQVLLVASCLFGLLGCASRGPVERKRGDVVELGRPIPGVAYAWYMRGLHAEEKGAFGEARFAYGRTLKADPKSALAYGALIRMDCRHRTEQWQDAMQSGLQRADRKGVVLSAAAQCVLSRGEFDRARRLSLRALADEPYLQSANRVLMAALLASDQERRAYRLSRAYRIATGRDLLAAPFQEHSFDLGAVDQALWRDDLEAARIRAVSLMSAGQLAARALGWGKLALAEEQARFVQMADPRDPDARIVLLLVEAQKRGDEQFAPQLEQDSESGWAKSPTREPSLLSVVLLTRELARNVGAEAALEVFVPFRDSIRQSRDPLVQLLDNETWTRGEPRLDPDEEAASGD